MSRGTGNLVAAIILAAGRASRAGVTKQLLELDGKPLLQHVVDNAASAAVSGIVVVLGHDQERVRRSIDTGSAMVVINPDHQLGQGTSLRCGIEPVERSFDAVIVLLGDQPGIGPEIIDAVIAAYRIRGGPIVVPRYEGRRGNPVLFDRSLFPELKAISGDTGARVIFERLRSDIEFVDFAFETPPDIDTMDDYLAAVERQAR